MTIQEQLLAAYERDRRDKGQRGWTWQRLAAALAVEGIKMDRSNLRKQMHGGLSMRTETAEALARIIPVTLAVLADDRRAS